MKLEKAQESLNAADLCFQEMLYNSTANRAYYAMFQAAIVALTQIGIQPKGEQWSHEGMQATFAIELTRKRKIFRSDMVRDLLDVLAIRNQADYNEQDVSKKDAIDALNAARKFVGTISNWIHHAKSTQRSN